MEPLEWITDSKVKGMTILEAFDIIEARLTRFKRIVKGNTPVKSNNKEIHIVTDTYACTNSHLLEKILKLELGIVYSHRVIRRTIPTFNKVPNITCIEEDCTIEAAKQLSAIF